MKQLLISSTSTIALGVILSGLVIFDASATDIGKLTENCVNCHGKDGVSSESDVPTIGGYSEQYLIDSMDTYKDKDRPCAETEYREGKNKGSRTDMCKIAEELSDEDTEEIAAFYANKEFVPAMQSVDLAKAALGAKIHKSNCEKCHEDGGMSADDDAGILAGQWMPYLESSFKDYVSGERAQPKKMKPKMDKLNDKDIESLIHYYGSLQ